MDYEIVCADVLDWAAEYEGEKFHAVLCDPPYHLTSPASHSGTQPTSGVYGRVNGGSKGQSGGFMGKRWDGGSIAFDPATWAAIAEHLHPGGFILAFGGSRTYHRLACAVEDAGLIVHPALVWLNGQGFPKATRLDKAIDKAAGAEREVVGTYGDGANRRNSPFNTADGWNNNNLLPPGNLPLTAPATPLAATWAGHRYGLQALKPCAEFILCAQKPYAGRPVDSIVSTGAGSLWIDGARVATGDVLQTGSERGNGEYNGWGFKLGISKQHSQGRWPPNVCLSHVSPHPCPACDGDGCPDCGGTGWLEGCRRVGTKRVRGAGWRDKDYTKPKPGDVYDGGWSQGGSHYADPDGTEQVDDWECVDGGSHTIYQYVHNSAALSPLDEPSYLLDQLQSLLESIQNYSTGDNNLLRGASEVYHSGRKLSAVSQGDLIDGVLCALALKGFPGFQFDCRSCQCLCDGLLRQVLGACQYDPPSLPDALSRVHQDLSELLHNLDRQCLCLPSNSDGSGQTYEPSHIGQSNISDSDHDHGTSPEIPCHTEGNLQSGVSRCGQPEHIQANRTCEGDNHKTPCCNAGRTALVKLLCLVSVDLAYRFILPAHIIQRFEIDVNFPICPVRALGEMSGERKSGGHKAGEKFPINRGGYAGGIGEIILERDYPPSTGTAVRFYPQSDWRYEIEERLAGVTPFMYQAKAARKERDKGLPDGERNSHPTVKPVKLCEWLARLLAPPPEYAPRRLLVPFSGSGSEMLGAALSGGWDEIVGVEMEPEYVAIAEARLAHWLENIQLELEL